VRGRDGPIADIEWLLVVFGTRRLRFSAFAEDSQIEMTMRLFRRQFLQLTAGAAALPMASRIARSDERSKEHAMPTQLKLFSTNESENFSKLEKEVNDWLAAKGDGIQPVNSQTATCAIENGGDHKQSQAVIIALWYLDPPERGHH
jgi:hypothetical protein